MGAKKLRKARKKEYFTVMVVPGPNAKVRTLSISKSLLKTVFSSLMVLLIVSLYLVYEYNDVKDKVWELHGTSASTQLTDHLLSSGQGDLSVLRNVLS